MEVRITYNKAPAIYDTGSNSVYTTNGTKIDVPSWEIGRIANYVRGLEAKGML